MEKYLRRCLDSLIIDEDGMKQLEVLVINDGSKDSSSQIAHEYQDKYPDTFRVIDKENGNYGSCINRGLKEATGKYVKVLDADDWFDTAKCDLAVFFNKMPEQFVGIRNSIEAVQKLPLTINEAHRTFLFDKIQNRIESLYRYILVLERKSPDYLKTFDADIVENYETIADALNNVKLHIYFPYHYIAMWRKSQRTALPITISLLGKCISSLKRLTSVATRQKNIRGEILTGRKRPACCISIMSNHSHLMAA